MLHTKSFRRLAESYKYKIENIFSKRATAHFYKSTYCDETNATFPSRANCRQATWVFTPQSIVQKQHSSTEPFKQSVSFLFLRLLNSYPPPVPLPHAPPHLSHPCCFFSFSLKMFLRVYQGVMIAKHLTCFVVFFYLKMKVLLCKAATSRWCTLIKSSGS